MIALKEREVDPGRYWRIEGYDVWVGLNRYEAYYCGSFLCRVRTLDEVRAKIRSAVFGPVS